jgi:hypothetical protein
MLRIVTEIATPGRRRLALVLLVICALFLANPAWCALQADHHAELTAADPALGGPSDDADPHCSTPGAVDSAIRAHAGDLPGPLATGSTLPMWHAPTTMPPVTGRAAAVPVTSHRLIRLCQLRL